MLLGSAMNDNENDQKRTCFDDVCMLRRENWGNMEMKMGWGS